MLVLSRKVGQSLRIGAGVRIKVVEVRGQQVRLGIEAPAEISITREEIANPAEPRPEEATDDDAAEGAGGESR